jgi:cyclopropane-fatty-acyl-phospholipid synthase
MDGGWSMERGALEDFLTAVLRSRVDQQVRGDTRALLGLLALGVRQRLLGTGSNVRAHYDIGEDLYDTFLDPTRGYSCGYERSPDDDIGQLQENKYERICQKLRLSSGETLFDVGCGYGGLVMHAAQRHGVKARGITNSRSHCDIGMRRVRALGLTDRVRIDFGDLREARGTYDKVVSVGVLEHQGLHEHDAFFDVLARLLSRRGEALGLLHTLGAVVESAPDPFVQKYVFPGSRHNALSRIARHLEKRRLAILDVENMIRHYAVTALRWLERFRAARHTLDPARYDARFCRMWEYYLALATAGARGSDGALWQVLFTPNYRRDLPMHRV